MSLFYKVRLCDGRVDIYRLANQYKHHEDVRRGKSIPMDTPAGSKPPSVVGEDQPAIGMRNRNQVEANENSSGKRDRYCLRQQERR